MCNVTEEWVYVINVRMDVPTRFGQSQALSAYGLQVAQLVFRCNQHILPSDSIISTLHQQRQHLEQTCRSSVFEDSEMFAIVENGQKIKIHIGKGKLHKRMGQSVVVPEYK